MKQVACSIFFWFVCVWMCVFLIQDLTMKLSLIQSVGLIARAISECVKRQGYVFTRKHDLISVMMVSKNKKIISPFLFYFPQNHHIGFTWCFLFPEFCNNVLQVITRHKKAFRFDLKPQPQDRARVVAILVVWFYHLVTLKSWSPLNWNVCLLRLICTVLLNWIQQNWEGTK